MKTITLDIEMTFDQALTYLKDGKCLGIKPGKNTNYVERYKPQWMNDKSTDLLLRWHGKLDSDGIRTNQYLGSWYPVIVDHREIEGQK